jgi:hypothetical protein
MNRNVKKISVFIDCEQRLKLIKETPALNQYFRNANLLTVGYNILSVNHYDFNRLMTSQLFGKAIITEINL